MASSIQKAARSLQAAVCELERRRKSHIFMFIQQDEEHMCHPAMDSIIEARDLRHVETLEVIVHSNGGHLEVAYKMAEFFRSRCDHLNMIVPLNAKSAATALCLGAENIFMGEFAELGPLDVQLQDPLEKGVHPFSPLDEFKSMEYLEEYAAEVLDVLTGLIINRSGMSIKEALHVASPVVAQMISPLYHKVDPSKVGGYRRSLAIGEEYAQRLLTAAGNSDVESLTQQLVWEYPSHDFVINYSEAKRIGLPVERLEKSQEKLLLKSLIPILKHGVSICALSKPPDQKRERGKRRPSPVPAIEPEKVHAATAD